MTLVEQSTEVTGRRRGFEKTISVILLLTAIISGVSAFTLPNNKESFMESYNNTLAQNKVLAMGVLQTQVTVLDPEGVERKIDVFDKDGFILEGESTEYPVKENGVVFTQPHKYSYHEVGLNVLLEAKYQADSLQLKILLAMSAIVSCLGFLMFTLPVLKNIFKK